MPRLVSTMLARSTPALSTDPIVADSNSVAMPVGITTVTVIGRPPLWTSPVPGELVLGTSLDNRRPTAIDPDVPPDMWWFDPAVRLADSRSVQATECIEQYLGRSWQRWSRHLNQGQWRSGPALP